MSDRPAEPEALSIGEMINLLKDEFPEVSVSKVRFLEDQGLVHPSRSDSGYRQFFADDVDRLRFILQQQRDHFLPLKVIKSKLTDWERGEEPDADAQEPEDRYLDMGPADIDSEELLRRAGLEPSELQALISNELIKPAPDGRFDTDALAIAREAKLLFARGLEPRHLRTLRLAADREADLLRQLSAGIRRNTSPEARRQSRELLSGAAKSFEAIHLRLLRRQIRAMLEE